MKTKLGASLIAALMMMGLFGVSQATAEPGPNGSNEKGLCTAYFNGQKNGHDQDGDGRSDPGPFGALEDDAEEQDNATPGNEDLEGETPIYSDVFEFCNKFGIGGQPEHNGRYDCKEPSPADQTLGRDADGDGEIECYPNTGGTGTDTGEDGTEYPYDTGNDHPSDKSKP